MLIKEGCIYLLLKSRDRSNPMKSLHNRRRVLSLMSLLLTSTSLLAKENLAVADDLADLDLYLRKQGASYELLYNEAVGGNEKSLLRFLEIDSQYSLDGSYSESHSFVLFSLIKKIKEPLIANALGKTTAKSRSSFERRITAVWNDLLSEKFPIVFEALHAP